MSLILLIGNLRLRMAKETQLESWELGIKLKLTLKPKQISTCPSFHSYNHPPIYPSLIHPSSTHSLADRPSIHRSSIHSLIHLSIVSKYL